MNNEHIDGPLVSIIVPTFNGERFVASALSSLLDQSYRHLDVVVVDDGSSDGTVAIVEDLAREDDRVTLVRACNRSIATSRNQALGHAHGDFIAFLDQDDLCPQGKIARQVAVLLDRPEVTALFGKTVIFASDATDAASVLAMDHGKPAYTMCLSAALFRRSVFHRVGPLNPKFKLADDFDFILRLIEAGLEIETETEVATLHRRHGAQATADLAATRREALLALAESLRRRRAAGNSTGLQSPFLAAIRP